MDGVQNSIESSFPVQPPCKFKVQYHSKINDNRASTHPVNLRLVNDSPPSPQQLNDNAVHGLQSSIESSLPVQFPCKSKVQHHSKINDISALTSPVDFCLADEDFPPLSWYQNGNEVQATVSNVSIFFCHSSV